MWEKLKSVFSGKHWHQGIVQKSEAEFNAEKTIEIARTGLSKAIEQARSSSYAKAAKVVNHEIC